MRKASCFIRTGYVHPSRNERRNRLNFGAFSALWECRFRFSLSLKGDAFSL